MTSFGNESVHQGSFGIWNASTASREGTHLMNDQIPTDVQQTLNRSDIPPEYHSQIWQRLLNLAEFMDRTEEQAATALATDPTLRYYGDTQAQ